MAHARLASTIEPNVQKTLINTNHAPRFVDGKNSMNIVNAVGTPPSPKPTTVRASSKNVNDGENADTTPATKVITVVKKKANRLPLASATMPQVGAPNSIPTNTTEVSLPSSDGDTPHSQRTDGPKNESSIISIASPIQAKPVNSNIMS